MNTALNNYTPAIMPTTTSQPAQVAHAPARKQINLADYVREAMDGVVGDVDLPIRFDVRAEQDRVCAQIERALTSYFRRSLTAVQRSEIGMAVAFEWNRRVDAMRTGAAA